MREIAEMVGLSQAGLLHHFSSKEELLEEVLRLRDEEQTAFNERFGRAEGLAAVRYLIDLVDLNARQAGLVRLYTVLAGESVSPGHPAREYFLDRYATVRERVAQRLRKAQDQDEISADADIGQTETAVRQPAW
jgi:AcrR family transcriptional regulator